MAITEQTTQAGEYDRDRDLQALESKSPEQTKQIIKVYIDILQRFKGQKYSDLTEDQRKIVDNAKEFVKDLRRLSLEEKTLNSKVAEIYTKQAGDLDDILNKNVKDITDAKAQSTEDRVKLVKAVPTPINVDLPKNLAVAEIIIKLSDLNGDLDLDDKNIIDEKNLKTLISRVAGISKGDTRDQAIQKLGNVFKNVTGEDPIDFGKTDVEKFQSKLLFNLNFLNSLGIGTGAISLLRGKMGEFVNGTDLKTLKPREIDRATYDKLSPTVQNILGGLLTAGVLRLSGGFVMAGHEARTFESDDFIKKLESQKNSTVLSKGLDILTWIKEALMGRKLSISFGQDKLTLEEIEKEVLKFTTEVMNLKLDGTDNKASITDKNLKENYDYAVYLIGNDPSKKLAMQKSLIQSYILTLGEANKGSDYRFTLGLLFIGGHRDNVDVDYVGASVDSELLKRDSLGEEKVSSNSLEQAGVKIEKKEDGKYKHIVPETLQLDGDDREFPVEIQAPEGVDIHNSDKLYDFHFTLLLSGRGKYVVTFTKRQNQAPNSSLAPSGNRDVRKQEISDVRNAREGNEKILNKTLDQVLYDIVGHQVAFGKLAKAVSRGDLEGAKSEITSLEAKFKNNKQVLGYLKLLKSNTNTNTFVLWDTYMSGNKETRAKKAPKYEDVRSNGVIKAENALASKTGFPKPSFEGDFEVKGDYNPKQISRIIPDQELTSVQFMTPVDNSNVKESRKALHRVSIQDGSFAVLEQSKPTFVTEEARKKQIVDGISNSSHESRGIKPQLDKLNKFLGENGKNSVEIEQYKNYLVNGKIQDLGVEGLKLQDGKDTKFLEARAMVAENICLNTTYAIGYPAFEIETGKGGVTRQEITPAGTTDMQAALNLPIVSGDRQALGGSALGFINEALNGGGKTSGDGKIASEPGVEPGGGTGTGGGGGTPITQVGGRG